MADRPRVNVFGVVMALIFLTVAVSGLTGNVHWLTSSGSKWLVAGLIALIGIGLLLSALPGRRRD